MQNKNLSSQKRGTLFLIPVLAVALAVSGCGKKEAPNPAGNNTNVGQVNENTNANANLNQNTNSNVNENQGAGAVENGQSGERGEEIDTSDWQTYRNEEYGFEVKYQPYWEKGAYGLTEVNEDIVSILMFNNYTLNQKIYSPLLKFIIFNKDPNLNILHGEYIDEKNINDLYFRIYKNKRNNIIEYYTTIKLKNNNYLLISVDQIEDPDSAKVTFEQIISTFKFIN